MARKISRMMTTSPARAALFFFKVSHITFNWDSGFSMTSPATISVRFFFAMAYASFPEYLILGSRKAYTTSTIRFIRTKITAISRTTPCTTGKSDFMMHCTV